MSSLNKKELYSRQSILPSIGKSGQEKIELAKVALLGTGALGTVAAELLARSGVGELLLIDRDSIELSNLQRQTLFTTQDVGKLKAKTAKGKLEEINPFIKISYVNTHLNAQTICELGLEKFDLVLDCTDNFKTKFLINDFCKKNKIDWIHAAVIREEGLIVPIFKEGPCLACFLPKNAQGETCAQAGVLSTASFSVAASQANMALHYILGRKVKIEMLRYNFAQNTLNSFAITKKEHCETCQGNYVHLDVEDKETEQFCSSGNFQIQGNREIDLEKLNEDLDERASFDGVALTIKGKNFSMLVFKNARALIKAKSKEEAEALYSRYIGN